MSLKARSESMGSGTGAGREVGTILKQEPIPVKTDHCCFHGEMGPVLST